MSSHREAPEISKDPVADNTDLYAFVSPNKPSAVTLIANFIPLQTPDGGPNFYEFGDDVLYEIHISNKGDARSDIVYEFRFHTKVRSKKTFLYNTGQIKHVTDSTWNRPQYFTLTKVAGGKRTVLAKNLTCPPVNVGVRSTPDYAGLAAQTFHHIKGDRQVFAGQRAEGFHVDLGSIFDLGTLRPFESLHLIPSANAVGVNASKTFNVHSIALEVPIHEVTRHHNRPTDVMAPGAVIGVWAAARRRKTRIFDKEKGKYVGHGPWSQVSRLGNPLFNEVIVPMAEKDDWNATPPRQDSEYAKFVNKPELGALLPVLYPGVFPHLAAYHKPRADLHAILLTGIPSGVVAGFQNFTGPTEADMLRLNVAVKPSAHPDPLGLVGGDAAGFPNGRRVVDDVTTIELRAIAGQTIPLVDPSFTPDGASAGIKDGTSNNNPAYRSTFPFLGTPNGGYQTKPGTSSP
jgi:uncharacterized protein DUF4331